MPNGKGKYIFKSGDWKGCTYTGVWKDDKMHGHGTFNYANGDRYVGQFKNNMMHGRGTFFNSDGTKVKGIWKNNVLLKEK